MNIKERLKQLKKDIPVVYIALKSSRTPVRAKVFAALTVAYALSPVDLIPDFIPLLGYIDDLVILPLLILLTVKSIPPNLWQDFRTQAAEMADSGVLKKWYYAIPTILIWVIILSLIIKSMFLH